MTIQEKVIADMQLTIDRQSELIRQERLRNRELEDQIRLMEFAGKLDNQRLSNQAITKPLPKVEV